MTHLPSLNVYPLPVIFSVLLPGNTSAANNNDDGGRTRNHLITSQTRISWMRVRLVIRRMRVRLVIRRLRDRPSPDQQHAFVEI